MRCDATRPAVGQPPAGGIRFRSTARAQTCPFSDDDPTTFLRATVGWLVAQIATYITRVHVRISDTIRIGYVDTLFLKRKSTKIVYSSIRIRISDEYRIRIRHPL